MTDRERFSSGVVWESIVGYSRAVRVGKKIYVSGTTATDASGALMGEGDAYLQAQQCVLNLKLALEAAGASLENVVRTRMFVTDISQWRDFGKAHCEGFDAIRPCTTMVEVRALIDSRMLIEIEAEAEL